MKKNKNTRVNAQAYIDMLAKDSEEGLVDDDLVKTIDEAIIEKIEKGEITDESLLEAIIDCRLSEMGSISNRDIMRDKRLIWRSVRNTIQPMQVKVFNTHIFKRASVIVTVFIMVSLLSLSAAGAIDWSVFMRLFMPWAGTATVNKDVENDIFIDKGDPNRITDWNVVPKYINGYPAVLNWVPDQYEFVYAIEISRSTTSSLSTHYSDGVNEMYLSVRYASGDSTFYGISEKDIIGGGIHVLGGKECTLINNFDNITMSWQSGNADYLLVCKSDLEDIEKMIISIDGGK